MGRTERLAQPQQFGKYHLVARLAHGRMADVYKAKSHGVEGFEKILCIKIMHPGLAANDQFVEALIEEAKRAVALSHANIAQVLDLGHEENQQKYYVAMEYVAGLDLARAMTLARRFEHPWPQEMSVFVAAEVAKALDYAHRRKDFNFNNLNILHRSLRPQNVMLSYDGEVKLTDFGISRAIEAVPSIDDEDEIYRLLCAAPEVAAGGAYTRQSDIFSVGLILYEMLSGTHPYIHDELDEVRRRASQAAIEPIQQFREVPRQLQQILESMLVADPAGRAPSAGQLYEELIGYLFGNSLQGDNRMLALTMQELRRQEQESPDPDVSEEAGLEEISRSDFKSAFAKGGAFHDEVSEAEVSAPQALPSSQIGPRSAASAGGGSSLPGPLEKLLRSVADGRGKAALLSGRMGRGRQVLVDRLVDAVDHRPGASSRLIHTCADDRYRPFGVFGDLILRSLHQTMADSVDHRRQGLDVLAQWGTSAPACQTMASLWGLQEAAHVEHSERKRHLLEILWNMLRHFAADGPFALVVDRVELMDQVSLDVLRDVIASIGDLPVLLVLGTRAEDTVRSLFDAGKPRDLEAIHVSGDTPPTPDHLRDLGDLANRLLTLLSLADRPLSAGVVATMLEVDSQDLHEAAEELTDRGAMRIPRPGRYRADVSNWLTWQRNQDQGIMNHLASTVARYYVHRLARGESDRLIPTLLRLYSVAGDRRQLLNLAGPYGQWLQQNAWQHIARDYYQHLSTLLGQQGLGVPNLRVQFVVEAAELSLEMAELETCRNLLEPLSALTEATRDEAGFVRAQVVMGKLAMQQDDLDEALTHFRRSVRTARSLKAPVLLAQSSLALASWHSRFGSPDEALQYMESAVNLDRPGLDVRTRAQLLQGAAQMWADRGMLHRAQAAVMDLQELASTRPYPSVQCRAAVALGRLAAHHDDIDTASTHYDTALGLANNHDLAALAIHLLRERAILSVHFGRYDEGITWANQIIGFAGQHGDTYSQQRARDLRALAQCHRGRNVDDALNHLRASLRRATERAVPKDVFRGHDYLARALAAIGRDDDAIHHREHADELGRSLRLLKYRHQPRSTNPTRL